MPGVKKPDSGTRRSWYMAAAVIAPFAIFGLFLLFLMDAGFFTLTESASSAQVVVASIALVGVLVTATVSGIGLVLKQVLDTRAEQRLAVEAERSATQKMEEERRLKLEAATH